MSKKDLSDELRPQDVFPAAEEEEEDDDKTRSALLARRTGKAVGRAKVMARGALLTAAGLVLLMGIIFAASALLNFEGSFTVKAVGPVREKKAISLSETEGFANPTVQLSASVMDQMDNITYEWLPLDELDTKMGSYNGENYIAYTFFITNSGEETLDYSAVLHVTECTLRVDKATRVMIYRNGEPTVYAVPREDGSPEPYPENVVNFESETTVFTDLRRNLAVGEKDRWTVVVWLEGEDPECVNDVRGGTMKMEMDMDILE